MKSKNICFIPIKSRSTRVISKNLRMLGDKPLFQYILDTVSTCNNYDRVVVDTDNQDIKDYCKTLDIEWMERDPKLAKDTANGNDLLLNWHKQYPQYDYYYQLFATCPFTSKNTIDQCVEILEGSNNNDSIFTSIYKCGWYWFDGKPINYNPKVLPRSQDAKQVVNETTALYGISSVALDKLKCRIGNTPFFYFVSDREAIDIDSEFDFKIAQLALEDRL